MVVVKAYWYPTPDQLIGQCIENLPRLNLVAAEGEKKGLTHVTVNVGRTSSLRGVIFLTNLYSGKFPQKMQANNAHTSSQFFGGDPITKGKTTITNSSMVPPAQSSTATHQ